MATTKGGSALARLQARTAPIAVQEGGEVEIPLEKIRFDATQPRKAFHHPDGQVGDDDQQAVQELAEAIKANGLIHAITVESLDDGTYRVVVGERRTRAHLLLGRKTIRALIRNDLAESRKTRLLFQLVENVSRQDLSDEDTARSIRELMEGSDQEPAMNQSQIAVALGKSEGWVSRYVKFGDDELQRLWWNTGIADTVEKVYRLSLLPKPVQVEIQRRVTLPVDDRDHIAKPILRGVIDDLAKQAKLAKSAPPTRNSAPASPPPETTDEAPTVDHRSTASDPVAAALATAVREGSGAAGAVSQGANAGSLVSGGYQLDDRVRQKILGSAQSTTDHGQRAAAAPPVNVRGTLGDLLRILKKAGMKGGKVHDSLVVGVTLPMPLAQELANAVTGVVVERFEVAAALQRAMTDE